MFHTAAKVTNHIRDYVLFWVVFCDEKEVVHLVADLGR